MGHALVHLSDTIKPKLLINRKNLSTVLQQEPLSLSMFKPHKAPEYSFIQEASVELELGGRSDAKC